MATKKTAKTPAKKATTKASAKTTAKKPAAKTAAKTVQPVAKPAKPRLGLVGRPKPKASDARMPGEQHPGQTGVTARLHDQSGSQIERERHMYGGSTTPKRGAGRTDKKAVARGRGRKK
ncbi:MAG: hypothetical protein JNJ64_16140 [Flavobacteriales bacterium]|nr:hypothetical protein [Flavobacteriales bacterium]